MSLGKSSGAEIHLQFNAHFQTMYTIKHIISHSTLFDLMTNIEQF